MRSRKEIEKDLEQIQHKTGPLTATELLSIEIQLDFRDLLQDQKEAKGE